MHYLRLLVVAAAFLFVHGCSSTAATPPPASGVGTVTTSNATNIPTTKGPVASEADYVKVCGICHLPSGEGVPGAFPPLDERLTSMANTQQGRNYLVGLLQNGLYGPIEVNNVNYNGAMPPLNTQLDDAGMAAMLNYTLTTFGRGRPTFTATEVADRKAAIGSTTGAQLRKDAQL